MPAPGLAARLLLALCWCAPRVGWAKVIERRLNGPIYHFGARDADLVFIGKFAFQCVGACGAAHGNPASRTHTAHALEVEAGMLRVSAHGLKSRGQVLVAYVSEDPRRPEREWSNVFRSRKAEVMSCADKLALAEYRFELTPPAPNASGGARGAEHGTHDFALQHDVEATRYVELADRPQFYYFAALNCAERELHAYVQLRLSNPGGAFSQHFSYEDQGLLELEIWSLAYSLALALGAAEGVLRLLTARVEHPPLMILNNALWVLVFAHALAVCFYGSYATHGHAPEVLLMWSEMLYISCDLIVMISAVLLARGWRVTALDFARRERGLLLGLSALYVCAYALVACYDLVSRDPTADVYPLLTKGALWLLVARVALFALCATYALRSRAHEAVESKRAFYARLLLFAAAWFGTLPASTLIALCGRPWARRFNALGTLYLLTHLLLTLAVYALRPRQAKALFMLTRQSAELDGLLPDSAPGRRRARAPSGTAVSDSEPFGGRAAARTHDEGWEHLGAGGGGYGGGHGDGEEGEGEHARPRTPEPQLHAAAGAWTRVDGAHALEHGGSGRAPADGGGARWAEPERAQRRAEGAEHSPRRGGGAPRQAAVEMAGLAHGAACGARTRRDDVGEGEHSRGAGGSARPPAATCDPSSAGGMVMDGRRRDGSEAEQSRLDRARIVHAPDAPDAPSAACRERLAGASESRARGVRPRQAAVQGSGGADLDEAADDDDSML